MSPSPGRSPRRTALLALVACPAIGALVGSLGAVVLAWGAEAVLRTEHG